MKQQRIALIPLIFLASLASNAQTELGESVYFPKDDEIQSISLKQSLSTDSLRVDNEVSNPRVKGFDYMELYAPKFYYSVPNCFAKTKFTKSPKSLLFQNRVIDLSMPKYSLWKGANIAFNGNVNHKPSLMAVASGSMTYHQNLGKWHISVSANANKYWLPIQNQLITQYGFGGTLGYQLNKNISLYAYGYYYLSNPLVGPAYSPYVITSSYGGYANIRFNEHFSTDVGVNRYINPMTGRWTTSPIVTPYVRVGKVEIGLPVGELIKSAVWGDRDNPMRNMKQNNSRLKKK